VWRRQRSHASVGAAKGQQSAVPTHEEQLERIWPVALGLALLDEEQAERLVEGALSRKPDLGVVTPVRAERLVTLEARSAQAPRRGKARRRSVTPSLLGAFLEQARRSHHAASRGARGARSTAQAPLRASAPPSTAPSTSSPTPDALSAAPPPLEQTLQTLRALPEQAREAWVFVKALRRDVRSASQAMDCSVTALQRLLVVAVEALDNALGERAPHAAALFAQALVQQPPPERFLRTPALARRVRRRRVLVRAVAALALGGAVVGLALWFIIRWTTAS